MTRTHLSGFQLCLQFHCLNPTLTRHTSSRTRTLTLTIPPTRTLGGLRMPQRQYFSFSREFRVLKRLLAKHEVSDPRLSTSFFGPITTVEVGQQRDTLASKPPFECVQTISQTTQVTLLQSKVSSVVPIHFFPLSNVGGPQKAAGCARVQGSQNGSSDRLK